MSTEPRFVQYGDRTMPVPDGLTLDQLKTQMARFFPELAEPAIETKKTADNTTYIFSKKAGRKGARRGARLCALTPIIKNLRALRPAPTDPTFQNGLPVVKEPIELAEVLEAEARQITAARHALFALTPAQTGQGDIL